MSYEAGSRLGKKGKETNGWFVGYAPRRNAEIVVAAVIQGSSEHGGTTAGPVVRDIVKAYYDKKSRAQRTTVHSEGRAAPGSCQSPGADPAPAQSQPNR